MKPTLSLKGRALRYLSMREHSRAELARKLSRYAEDGDDIEHLLDGLESAKFLSDERFSESLVNRRAARFGNNRIVAELKTHNVDKAAISHIEERLSESEMQRAIDVLHRKYPHPPVDHLESFKQQRFLQRRGFSSTAIRQAMRAARDDTE